MIKGRSGVGKTTLLHVLAGLKPPQSGTLQWFGKTIDAHQVADTTLARSQNMAFVYQDFQLVRGLSALENVMLPMALHGMEQAKERATEWLNRLDLTDRHQHLPDALSGGEQQRVGLARALAMAPRVIFADEPSGQLDDQTSIQLLEHLQTLKTSTQTTWVICTHDDRFLTLASHAFTLQEGQLTPL